MKLELLIHHRRELLNRIFLRRIFGQGINRAVLLVAGAILLAGLMFSPSGLWQGAGITAGVLLALVFGTGWKRHCRAMDHFFSVQGDQPVRVQLTDTSFRAESARGTTELRWDVMNKLAMHPDFLLLFYSEEQCVTLPAAELPAEVIQFIREMFSQRGLPVVAG